MSDAQGEALLSRLRQLALADPDALLAGAANPAALLAAYAEDLADALSRARERAAELLSEAQRGPEPYAILDAAPRVRGREGGPDAAARATERLSRRAAIGRELAALDEAAAELLPRLIDADRRRQ